MIRVLLDTNVVLDYILERADHNKAAEIFDHLDKGHIEVFVAAITPINVFYTTRKEKNKDAAQDAVSFLLDAVQFCLTDQTVLQNAFDLGFSDYEDAVQCSSAIAEGLDAIVTRNTKDFETSPITVFSPAEFLNRILDRSEESI